MRTEPWQQQTLALTVTLALTLTLTLTLTRSFRMNGFEFPSLPVQLFAPPRPAVTWFLVAIVLWRMTLPGFALMRRPLCLGLGLG